MKITVVLREDGTLVGTARQTAERSDVQTALRPIAGHTLMEIDAPDHYERLSADELHEMIRSTHLRGHCNSVKRDG